MDESLEAVMREVGVSGAVGSSDQEMDLDALIAAADDDAGSDMPQDLDSLMAGMDGVVDVEGGHDPIEDDYGEDDDDGEDFGLSEEFLRSMEAKAGVAAAAAKKQCHEQAPVLDPIAAPRVGQSHAAGVAPQHRQPHARSRAAAAASAHAVDDRADFSDDDDAEGPRPLGPTLTAQLSDTRKAIQRAAEEHNFDEVGRLTGAAQSLAAARAARDGAAAPAPVVTKASIERMAQARLQELLTARATLAERVAASGLSPLEKQSNLLALNLVDRETAAVTREVAALDSGHLSPAEAQAVWHERRKADDDAMAGFMSAIKQFVALSTTAIGEVRGAAASGGGGGAKVADFWEKTATRAIQSITNTQKAAAAPYQPPPTVGVAEVVMPRVVLPKTFSAIKQGSLKVGLLRARLADVKGCSSMQFTVRHLDLTNEHHGPGRPGDEVAASTEPVELNQSASMQLLSSKPPSGGKPSPVISRRLQRAVLRVDVSGLARGWFGKSAKDLSTAWVPLVPLLQDAEWTARIPLHPFGEGQPRTSRLEQEAAAAAAAFTAAQEAADTGASALAAAAAASSEAGTGAWLDVRLVMRTAVISQRRVEKAELKDPFCTRCLADYAHLQSRFTALTAAIASAKPAEKGMLEVEKMQCGSILDKMEADQTAGTIDPFDYATLLQARCFRDVELCKELMRRGDTRAGAVKARATELKANVESLVTGGMLTAEQLAQVKKAAKSFVYKS